MYNYATDKAVSQTPIGIAYFKIALNMVFLNRLMIVLVS